MHPRRLKLLGIIAFSLLILGIAVALLMYALRQNISLFYTPSQIRSDLAPHHQLIRVGGMVVSGSLHRSRNTLDVVFDVTDLAETMTVKYQGILPDLFREGQGIVALGKISADGEFLATQVLAKHDENYMPPEVKSSLKPSNLLRKT